MHLLNAEQQDRLRRLVRRSPAFIGMKVVVHDDYVETFGAEELQFGFDTVSARLAQTPEADWPDVVDDWFRMAIATVTTEAPELTGPTEDLLDRVYQRLSPAELKFLPDYTFPISPDLQWTLVLDQPDSITMLNDEHVARHGFDRLSEAGFVNLCNAVPEQVAIGEGGVHILEGSDYVGSLLLVTPWLTELMCDEPEPPYGVLVAAPDRNTTIFHLIRTGVETRYAVGEIARVAKDCADTNSHPLSPQVHWWRPGRIDPVTGPHGGDGADELDALLRELS